MLVDLPKTYANSHKEPAYTVLSFYGIKTYLNKILNEIIKTS